MATAQKDTVYVDIDDEITSIIDKVRSSKKKIVALVLPKRAAALQSIVNMKLLKRSAQEAKKNIVLITSESSLLPLAGAVGLHVAKTLQSKPYIPKAPVLKDEPVDVKDSAEITDETGIDPTTPIGELADSVDAEETIEIDEEDTDLKKAGSAAAGSVAAKKTAGNKKFKIPNFNKFRLRLILGIVALLLVIGGWFVAFYVLPEATVMVRTETTTVATDMELVASPTTESLDTDNQIVPATIREVRESESETVEATGEKDEGKKARGEVLLSIPCSTQAPTIPSGTGVSTGDLTYIMQNSAYFPFSSATEDAQGSCVFQSTVTVAAQEGGEKYNIESGRSFTVAGYSSVTGVNEKAIDGGTTDIVKVVSQDDIDSARQTLIDRATANAEDQLTKELREAGYVGIDETFEIGDPTITSEPKVGAEADEVTVNAVISFSMLGLDEQDLTKLIESEVADDIDGSRQVILDKGLDEAVLRVLEKRGNGDVRISLQTSVVAGPQIDEQIVKSEVIGKKKGQAITDLEDRPGVQEASIEYSPFWVYTTPKQTEKITVEFEHNNTNVDSGQ